MATFRRRAVGGTNVARAGAAVEAEEGDAKGGTEEEGCRRFDEGSKGLFNYFLRTTKESSNHLSFASTKFELPRGVGN